MGVYYECGDSLETGKALRGGRVENILGGHLQGIYRVAQEIRLFDIVTFVRDYG